MNPFETPDRQAQLDDLRDELRVCGDDNEKLRLKRELDRLEVLQAEHARAAGQLKADQAARLADGEARTAASKAKYDRQQGALQSGVEVQDREADTFMLQQLRAKGKLLLAHKRIGERKLYPVHAKLLLACYVDELKAAQPELAPFVDDIVARGELPKFASDEAMRELEGRMYAYVPPPPPPPEWPDPVEAYVDSAKAVAEACFAQGLALTWQDPVRGTVQAILGGNWGSPRPKESVLAAVARGAKLAWQPNGRRMLPPKLVGFAGARWVEAPAGDGLLLAIADAKGGPS